jgi:predicted Rossmann-fold nucleotide-binding protein
MDIIKDRTALDGWIASGAQPPATVLGIDCTGMAKELASASLRGSIFVGCATDGPAAAALCEAGAKVLEELGVLPPSLPAFATGIYTVPDLYRGLKTDGSDWDKTPDHAGFAWFMQGPSVPRQLDLVEMLAARLHDSVQERDVIALLAERKKIVAIMGGHDFKRQQDPADATAGKPDIYWNCVTIAKTLAEHEFTILSGGGPGLMEAANLGALLAGASDTLVADVKAMLPNHPFGSNEWRATAMAARTHILGKFDAEPTDRQISVGIPTWYYGHEPPNMFASHQAKMFYNSLREDGLVTWANKGIIFFEGSGGTVQEIFQDASQNYYPPPKTVATPMVFFNAGGYWDRPCTEPYQTGSLDKRKPLKPLLMELAAEKNFTGAVTFETDVQKVIEFIIEADKAAAPVKADLRLGIVDPR